MTLDVENLLGSKVTIRGHVGGFLYESCPGIINTDLRIPTVLIIEDAPAANALSTSLVSNNDANPRRNTIYVAFRVEGTSRYLTLNPYGSGARAHTLDILSSCEMPMLLPDLYGNIVDYIVGDATDVTSWEGNGFNYAPMTAEESTSPTILQSFCIEGNDPYNVGIKSIFGNYWRSQHWKEIISQSSHLMRDETWKLLIKRT